MTGDERGRRDDRWERGQSVWTHAEILSACVDLEAEICICSKPGC